MIISIQIKNFYSIRDAACLDFIASGSPRRYSEDLSKNIIEAGDDRFVNIIGLFGGNASGKSNFIKAVDFCRSLILNSDKYNHHRFDFEPFKFSEPAPSEFHIDFIHEGIEYEYGFILYEDKIEEEYLYYFPKRRRAKVFHRKPSGDCSFGKGTLPRPNELITDLSPRTLILSRGSKNRELLRTIYNFFEYNLLIGIEEFDIRQIESGFFTSYKDLLLEAFDISDSDIADIALSETSTGTPILLSYHRENPAIAFDFFKEESEGTKRLLFILAFLLQKPMKGITVFIDEFDLKLHLRLSEFLLDVVRATRGAQLVFTSHNTALINRHNLRDEQIVFVNKTQDGNSDFYSLFDFKDISKNLDAERAYKLGLFDAVPYTGSYDTILSILEKK